MTSSSGNLKLAQNVTFYSVMTSVNLSNVPQKSMILCSYQNLTKKLQIIRTKISTTGLFERVVFPGQHLLFEAEPEGDVEVYYPVSSDVIEMKKILSSHLKVDEVI